MGIHRGHSNLQLMSMFKHLMFNFGCRRSYNTPGRSDKLNMIFPLWHYEVYHLILAKYVYTIKTY